MGESKGEKKKSRKIILQNIKEINNRSYPIYVNSSIILLLYARAPVIARFIRDLPTLCLHLLAIVGLSTMYRDLSAYWEFDLPLKILL